MPVLAQGQQGDQGQFLDPIVGSWIVHATVDTYTPNPGLTLPFQFDALESFWGNGITITSDPTNGTAYGVWKRSGLPRTYDLNSYGLLLQHWDCRREQSEQVFLDPSCLTRKGLR
jgi:hypothetical protein